MILRLSQKLARKIKVSKLVEMPLDENPSADWFFRLLRGTWVFVSLGVLIDIR